MRSNLDMCNPNAITAFNYLDNEAGFITKDSGERVEYDSGMRRDVNTGKDRFDLIPIPMLKRLAGLYGRGAVKYANDIKITESNIKELAKCLCTCRLSITTTIENQTATLKEDMPEKECAYNAMCCNTQKQQGHHAIQNESHSTRNIIYAEVVTTNSLSKETPSTQKDNEKTTMNGLGGIAKNSSIASINISQDLKINCENLQTIDLESSSPSESQSKMKKKYLNYKTMPAQYAENNQIESTLTSTTITKQEKQEDLYAEDATRASVYSKIVKNELKKHLNTCKIHLSVAYDSNNQPYVPSSVMNNWQLANSIEEMNRFKESAFRHFMQWANGEVDEDHAMAVVFNLFGYETTKEKLSDG